MPRTARIDFPKALHHVMARGINKQIIFHDKQDYLLFLNRIERYLAQFNMTCFAWVLMPNHIHLLIKTDQTPLTEFMKPLLISYALYFNKRYNRIGHLFQNRFKSILCDQEKYLSALIQYIHLNPVRSKLVNTLNELDYYPWCGHSAIVGNRMCPFLSSDNLLQNFHNNKKTAEKLYRQFLHDGITTAPNQKLAQGDIVLLTNGIWQRTRHAGIATSTQGILGDKAFIIEALTKANQPIPDEHILNPQKVSVEKMLNTTLQNTPIPNTPKALSLHQAQAVICQELKERGLSQDQIARTLKISQPTVSRILKADH